MEIYTLGVFVGRPVKMWRWTPHEAGPGLLQTVAMVWSGLTFLYLNDKMSSQTPFSHHFPILRAMAELGPGPHRTGDIADLMEVKITGLGPTRANLIKKGMVFSPSHGEMAFTVPLFDKFMRRAVPEFPPNDSI